MPNQHGKYRRAMNFKMCPVNCVKFIVQFDNCLSILLISVAFKAKISKTNLHAQRKKLYSAGQMKLFVKQNSLFAG